ncbi:MAG TPA: PQQ-dependent sugar dehydrogenase [Polyangiaceae bacterium]|nr:PQQ-dependent sugar dehydrogenase [Polyangiaceae bacterium]
MRLPRIPYCVRVSPMVLPCLVATLGCESDDSSDPGGTGGSGGTSSTSSGAGAGGTGDGGSGGAGTAAGGTLGVAGEGGDDNAAGAGGAPDDRSVFRPEVRDFSESYLDDLSVPDGFALSVYATDLQHARMLAVHGDHVYLTRPLQGDVLRFVDEDADGEAESTVRVVTDLMQVHGIAFSGSSIFLATDKQVYRGAVNDDGNVTDVMPIGEELPDGGQHPYRTLGVGPDEMLYISVGSNCDACEQLDPELAAMLRANLNGLDREVFASGLRNTIGFGWHPNTDELWGLDHGSDWRGNDLPPEELNRIASGNDYGWPYCFAKREPDPVIEDPMGMSKQEYCAETTPSVLEYQAHGAPIGMAFYTEGNFPEDYEGDAFVAMHGSWNRFPPTGYGVVRLHFEQGEPTTFEDFVSGFLIEEGRATFGRPAGIVVAPDGALLFSDDANGIVYRVSYDGE